MNPDKLKMMVYKVLKLSKVNNKIKTRNMRTSFILAALATATAATQIVFKVGTVKVDGAVDEENRTRASDFRPSPSDWKMQFRWPKIPGNWRSYRCTATMIEPQVAITAAHCVRSFEAGFKTWQEARLKVRIGDQNRTIKEIRVPECWDYVD